MWKAGVTQGDYHSQHTIRANLNLLEQREKV
jgi:hypothetical protein